MLLTLDKRPPFRFPPVLSCDSGSTGGEGAFFGVGVDAGAHAAMPEPEASGFDAGAAPGSASAFGFDDVGNVAAKLAAVISPLAIFERAASIIR